MASDIVDFGYQDTENHETSNAVTLINSDDNCSLSVSSDSGIGNGESTTPAGSLNDPENEPSRDLGEAYNAYSESLGYYILARYEFEIRNEYVGMLIGRYGSFVNKIKLATGASILVKKHYRNTGTHKIVALEGLCSEIEFAIAMIRERFPIKRFPGLSLDQVNYQRTIPSSVSILPTNNKLILIEGVSSDVTVSVAASLTSIFLQHPFHPTYTAAFSTLHETLGSFYESTEAPQLLPFNVGVICVARVRKNWHRAEVVQLLDKCETVVKLLDEGGYVQVNLKDLRQIRADFLTIPFQATECCLADVLPIDKVKGWSEEAIYHFKYLSQGEVLRAIVVGYDVDNDYCKIYLYKIIGSQPPLLINKELSECGLVKFNGNENIQNFNI